MAIKTLTIALIACLLMSAKGCVSIGDLDARTRDAARDLGQARAQQPLLDLPPACTVKMGRVKPGGEPWVLTQKRWEVLAENRDRHADDCAAWDLQRHSVNSQSSARPE